jgi:hypothetical protein
MDKVTADTAFRAMIARYEDNGWEVRALDTEHSRAFVRTVAHDRATDEDRSSARVPWQPTCRKLWIDAEGTVHETSVPC